MGAARLSSSAPAAILAGFHRSLMRMPSPDSIDLLSPFLVPPSDARHRLFHGRGKTLPGWEGLTLDRFPPVLVATLFVAGRSLQVFYQIPFSMVQLIQAILVICVASSEFFIRHRIRRIQGGQV